jgi:hypothetical protein
MEERILNEARLKREEARNRLKKQNTNFKLDMMEDSQRSKKKGEKKETNLGD